MSESSSNERVSNFIEIHTYWFSIPLLFTFSSSIWLLLVFSRSFFSSFTSSSIWLCSVSVIKTNRYSVNGLYLNIRTIGGHNNPRNTWWKSGSMEIKIATCLGWYGHVHRQSSNYESNLPKEVSSNPTVRSFLTENL